MAEGLHTLRPDGILEPGAWSAQPGGTLDGVTSDDNNSTYAQSPPIDSNGTERMRLSVNDQPIAANERVARYRVRAIMSNPQGSGGATYRTVANPGGGSWPNALRDGIITPGEIQYSSEWVQPSELGNGSEINGMAFVARVLTGPADGRMRVHEAYIDIDVRDPIEITDLRVIEPVNVDQCGGTVTDTQAPTLRLQSNYGYIDATASPPSEVAARVQAKVFTNAQVGEPGFDPWIGGPWGDPAWDLDDNVQHNGVGLSQTREFDMDKLQNDDYHVFARFGTEDFLNVTGETWWGNTATCAWTQDFPTPDPPTIATTVEECPPSVAVEVEHVPNTTPPGWDDPDLVRVQVQKTDTIPSSMLTVWRDVLDPDNGSLLPEDESIVITDRFVQVSAAATDPCADPGIGPIDRQLWYRARLYGYIMGVPANTEWAEASPVTVGRCTTERCPTWLIHPQSDNLNWVGVAVDAPWTDTRPHNATQAAEGGRPTVVVGRPTGRDHQVRLYTPRTPVLPIATADPTPSTGQLRETLAAPVLWFIPDNPALPAIWVAPGPTNNYAPLKINTGHGYAHAVDALLTEVDPPVIALPEADEPEPVSS